MASRKQTKKSAAARNTAKQPQRGGKRAAKAKRPIRREVGAVVCLLLGLCAALACFGIDAPGLNVLSVLFRGLIGAGLYILPFSLLMGFIILLLHDGRPVVLRVTCAMLLSVTIGALVHVFTGGVTAGSDGLIPALWQAGIDDVSGGVLGGLLAEGLMVLIGNIGAAIVLLAALLLELITTLNMTISGIITAIRDRPRPEYDEPKHEHPDPAQAIVNHVAQKQIERTERRAARSEFDLPVDDPPLADGQGRAAEDIPVPQPAPRRKRGERPVSPDEFLTQQRRPQPQPQESAETESEHKQRFDALLDEFDPALCGRTGAQQMPPLVLDHAPVEVPAAPAAPVVEKPAPAPVEPAPAAPEFTEEKIKKSDVLQEAARIDQQVSTQEEKPAYRYPPIDLLACGSGKAVDGTEEMRQNSARLSDTLVSFGIEANIINVTRGPSITRYELELSRGTKLSKVTNLADDIALALGASGVRIAAIPDKISVVGIEVPNRAVSTVFARDVIDSPEFKRSKSCISFAVGKDIGGNQIIGDIAKLPHMLIAGTTGSGKSVCMNSLIVSLLYKSRPDEVKLIMVDPKMVELRVYDKIPHLLIPVVTDPKKAAGALQWSVTEMMRRYRTLADAGVRDLESFNKVARSTGEYEPMPRIVVVIDELADLMLVAAKEVEESICRVAQMGRAAGVHLVIATQRPSADVITGLMKANIPSRIAFAVASAMESRIILDTAGAEKLVGKGDMLYAPLGQGKPRRVQGCFITEDEVQRVVDFVKQDSAPEYSREIEQEIERRAEQGGKSSAAPSGAQEADEQDGDELTPAAVEVLLETGQASVSMLQRRLKLGYARAARIMDELEEKGIVGPFEGSKPRQILVTREQWESMKGGAPEDFNQAVEEEIP